MHISTYTLWPPYYTRMFQQSYASHDLHSNILTLPILIIAKSDNFEGHTCLKNRFGSTFKPKKDLNVIIKVVRNALIWIYFQIIWQGPLWGPLPSKTSKVALLNIPKICILKSKNLIMIIKMWHKSLIGSKVDPNLPFRHVWYVTFFKKILRQCNKKRNQSTSIINWKPSYLNAVQFFESTMTTYWFINTRLKTNF